MSLPLSSLCGSLTEEDYRSHHTSSSLPQRRKHVRKMMNPELSLSVLATLDRNEDRNNKLSSSGSYRKAGRSCFEDLDSLVLIASTDVENQHDRELKTSKFQTKNKNLKLNPVKRNEAHRIDEGWSSSLLLSATAFTERSNQPKKTSESFISSLVKSSSMEERKPKIKPSKHVQFGSSVLCQIASSFEDENHECDVYSSNSAKAVRGKNSRTIQQPLAKVPDALSYNKRSIIVRKGHALKQAYAVAGKTYPKGPAPLRSRQLRRIQQQESVLLLASSANNSSDDRWDCSSKVDDHFLSLFQNQASLNNTEPKSSDPRSSLDDPLNKRTIFASPSLTVNRRTKRHDGKKTPIGKFGFSDNALDPKAENLSTAVLEDQQMEDCAMGGWDDDTASSLSDESISERWCQSSPVSPACSPSNMLPTVATVGETSPELDEIGFQDITSSLRSEKDAHESPKHVAPNSPQMVSSLATTTRSISLNDEVLMQSEMETSSQTPEKDFHETPSLKSLLVDSSVAATTQKLALNDEILAHSEMEEKSSEKESCTTLGVPLPASKGLESKVTSISIQHSDAMLVDDTGDATADPSKRRSMNDSDPGSVQNAIRRSRRVRVATDRYIPTASKLGEQIPEASSSNRILKSEQNKQRTDAQPSKSMQQKCDTKFSQEVFRFSAPSLVLPKEPLGECYQETAHVCKDMLTQEVTITRDTTIKQKPMRERKPTDFFHNRIQEFVPTKHPTRQADSRTDLACPSTNEALQPKALSTGIPRCPPADNVANHVVEDLSVSELHGWTAYEIQQLREAHSKVDPTSSSFWSDIANTIHTRTAAECQSQWFSLAKTPAPKTRKVHSKLECHHDDENDDDIFQSTPMRENVYPNSSISHLPPLSDSGPFPAIPMVATKFNDSGVKQEIAQNKAKPFSKAFLQRMRKDHVKAEQGSHLGPKANKGLHGLAYNQVLSEVMRDSEIDINIRLTPGGTLKVKSHVEDDDFWDEVYDDDDDL